MFVRQTSCLQNTSINIFDWARTISTGSNVLRTAGLLPLSTKLIDIGLVFYIRMPREVKTINVNFCFVILPIFPIWHSCSNLIFYILDFSSAFNHIYGSAAKCPLSSEYIAVSRFSIIWVPAKVKFCSINIVRYVPII